MYAVQIKFEWKRIGWNSLGRWVHTYGTKRTEAAFSNQAVSDQRHSGWRLDEPDVGSGPCIWGTCASIINGPMVTGKPLFLLPFLNKRINTSLRKEEALGAGASTCCFGFFPMVESE